MKKSLVLALMVGLFMAGPTSASTFYLADDDITIDNVVDEAVWNDHKVVTDKVDDPNRTQFCWNTTLLDWDEVTKDDCTTYLYDPLGQIDLLDGWFGVNETNMILAFETAVPMFAIKNMTTGEYFQVYRQDLVQETGIDELPTAFDHDMVFAFDANPDSSNVTSFDWYLVANIQYEIGQAPQAGDDDFLQVVKESGDHDGFQADEDEVIDNLDNTQSETANDGGTVSSVMEIRQNVEHFYELTGMTAGDEVKFRLETHSSTGDTTKAVRLVFVDSNKITEDALVVGSGATAFDGRRPKEYGTSTVTAYTLGDQTIQLQFEAYDKKVGVQVATGDVDGDGDLEIVTLPLRQMSKPEWKVFSHTGELLASGVVTKEDDAKRLKKYHLAAGDVDGDGTDEIVLSNASGNRLLLDVFSYSKGEVTRVTQYDVTNTNRYINGAWVEVANVDQSEDGTEEIVTAPAKGSPVIDVFSVTDGVITNELSYFIEETDFPGGLHIAATNGAVLVSKHSADGDLQLLVWDDEASTFTNGPMDTMNADTTIGKIGDLAWLNSGNYVYSSFEKKTVTYHSYNAANGDEDTVTTNVGSRASFVDFYEVE